MDKPLHPFYPIEANYIGYLANDRGVLELLGIFGAGCAALIAVTLTFVNRFNPRLRGTEKATVVWFVFTGCIHFFFEGYFSFNQSRMLGQQDIFGQLWKEYALADSRYMVSDPFVLCMETITAMCWGPLSFLTAYMVTSGNSLRYSLQLIVSLGQIYGDVLYYGTSLFDLYYKGLKYCRPEAYYFWFYYFFMNFIWIVIPGVLMYDSITETSKAFKAKQQASTRKAQNGSAKKLH